MVNGLLYCEGLVTVLITTFDDLEPKYDLFDDQLDLAGHPSLASLKRLP